MKTLQQEKEKYKHDLEERIKAYEKQEAALHHKDKEISHQIKKEEQYNNKIMELNTKIKKMKENEDEFEIQEEEHRKEIQDLTNALNSQGHNE